jgi:hypothetical protein
MEPKLEESVRQAGEQIIGDCGKSLDRCNTFIELNQGVTDTAYIQVPCHNICKFSSPENLPEDVITCDLDAAYTQIRNMILHYAPR